MKRFLVTCAYDGSAYAGWQSQKGKTCIQSEIEKALAIFDQDKPKITGSGRTDAKVHALAQRFHFDTNLNINELQIIRAINSHLPNDIRILEAKEVNENTHARFSAVLKYYDYLINNKEYNVLTRNYQTFVKEKLDIKKMREAALVFIGRHDFTTFCATTLEEKNNQIRDIKSIDINEDDGLIRLEFCGDGFLRYMVRMITGTLIEVGKGKIQVEDIKRMIEEKDKKACRYNAQAEGLYLKRITYEDD